MLCRGPNTTKTQEAVFLPRCHGDWPHEQVRQGWVVKVEVRLSCLLNNHRSKIQLSFSYLWLGRGKQAYNHRLSWGHLRNTFQYSYKKKTSESILQSCIRVISWNMESRQSNVKVNRGHQMTIHPMETMSTKSQTRFIYNYCFFIAVKLIL